MITTKSKSKILFIIVAILKTFNVNAVSTTGIIKNNDNYNKFINIIKLRNFNNPFYKIPESEKIIRINNTESILIHSELTNDNNSVRIIGYKKETTNQNATRDKLLYKKEFNLKNKKISDYKLEERENTLFLLLCNKEKNISFQKINKSNGEVIKRINVKLINYFKLTQKKRQSIVFDPNNVEGVRKLGIIKFKIYIDNVLILFSDKTLYNVNLVTNEVIWIMDMPNPYCSLKIFQNNFYYVHGKNIFARNFKTGKIIFKAKLSTKYKNKAFVVGFETNPDILIIGTPSNVSYTVHNLKTGKLIYKAPFTFIAVQTDSVNRNNTSAGSPVFYKYYKGVIYISWYDQWKPKLSKGWLSAYDIKSGKILWNIPLRYNNSEEIIAEKMLIINDKLQLFGRKFIIILKSGANVE